ncbi:MAG: TetR/AcrR family transcriptional regulator [Coriobacteriales bacterium]
MYHVKRDKRAIRSAHAIYEGLSSLIERKAYDAITVTDVQRESGVGRATFYRSFDRIDDVLRWRCDMLYREVMGSYLLKLRADGESQDPNAFLRHFFGFWMDGGNSRILEQLIKVGHYDIIYRCHFDSTLIIKRSVPAKSDLADRYYRYYMSGLIGAFVGFLISWIEGGKELTVDELVGLLESIGSDDGLKAMQ